MADKAKFDLIDMEKWERKQIFEMFFVKRRATFDLTVNVDITGLMNKRSQNQGLRFFPMIMHAFTKVINRYPEYRCSLDQEGRLGVWGKLNPLYTVSNEETSLFTHVYTEYHDDFEVFYNAAVADIEQHKNNRSLFAQGRLPDNVYSITSLPWTSYTGLSYNLYGEGTDLLPFVTIGKFFKQEDKVLLPATVVFHHAVCDGFHASRFFREVEQLTS